MNFPSLYCNFLLTLFSPLPIRGLGIFGLSVKREDPLFCFSPIYLGPDGVPLRVEFRAPTCAAGPPAFLLESPGIRPFGSSLEQSVDGPIT